MIYIDENGGVYLSVISGSATVRHVSAYPLGSDGYAAFTLFYRIALAAVLATLVAGCWMLVSADTSASGLMPLGLSAVNAAAAVAAAFLARSRGTVEVDLGACKGETHLSISIYMFIITLFASQGVQFLQRGLEIGGAIFFLLGALCVWRMVVWRRNVNAGR